MSTQIEQSTDHLKDYLTGMHRVDNKALAQISSIDDWATLAQEELRRRVASRTLGCIDDQTLAAIANGHISLQEVATEMLQTSN